MAHDRIGLESQSRMAPDVAQPEAAPEDPRRQAAMMKRALQRKNEGGAREQAISARAHQAADKGVSGAGGSLPHADKLQQAFGPDHDLSSVKAHVGGKAAEGSQAIGARAYTSGSDIAFKQTPDLRLAAHEAAHVVQQRSGQGPSGGVGKEGDSHEKHADEVADAVVSGKSAAPLLAGMKGGGPSVQRAVQMEGEPEIAATEDAMGEHVAQGMEDANKPPTDKQTGAITGGVQYWYNAQPMIEEQGGKWQDNYRMGHHFTSWSEAESDLFTQPDQTGQFMNWDLKPGHSASKALQAWLKGPTIAECLSTVIALETDALRATLGDQQFDALFGSEDAEVDKGLREKGQQLNISAGNNATVFKYNLIKGTDLAKSGKKPGQVTDEDLAKLKKGDWYYFKNHPQYLKKHPGGAWQGENAIFMGEDDKNGGRQWAGLGAGTGPESDMFESMTGDYNRERDNEDRRVMIEAHVMVKDDKKGTEEYEGHKYRITDPSYVPGAFPDQVDEDAVKTAGGGLLPGSGMRLNDEKIKPLVPEKEEAAPADDAEKKDDKEHEIPDGI